MLMLSYINLTFHAVLPAELRKLSRRSTVWDLVMG